MCSGWVYKQTYPQSALQVMRGRHITMMGVIASCVIIFSPFWNNGKFCTEQISIHNVPFVHGIVLGGCVFTVGSSHEYYSLLGQMLPCPKAMSIFVFLHTLYLDTSTLQPRVIGIVVVLPSKRQQPLCKCNALFIVSAV